MNREVLAFDFVFGSLTPAERAQMKLRVQYDRALASDIACIESTMGPLALSPDEAPISSGLWDRIEAEIASDDAEHPAIVSESFEDGNWTEWRAGIEIKPIWNDTSFLVRCAPGAVIAPHRHPLDERILVMTGEIRVGSRRLSAGDFQFSPAGSTHDEMHSAGGCTLFIQRVAALA